MLTASVAAPGISTMVQPLTGSARDYDALLDMVADARVVLLGEASHGTHEFYRERARITHRLIEERGFNAVAVEADWPDAYRVNRWVRCVGDDRTAVDALSDFQWFPRERFGDQAFLVGFSTYTGTATAASDWDSPPERKRVRPGMSGSWEALFHGVGPPNFLLPLKGQEAQNEAVNQIRLERAIGVIYRPETERVSHYFEAHLPQQFDAVIHFDETRAVEPLDRTAGWDSGEPPDTYPSGL